LANRILLVEDNEDDSMGFAQVVGLIMQHDVVVARNGLDAVRLAHEENFDLVLLDLRLPGLSGSEVAQKLRAMANYREVPIIALTAYDHPGIRKQSLTAGCNQYLIKPVDVNTIINTISAYLPPRDNFTSPPGF
jgi:CheY-like chemotaxis protein